MKCFCFKPADNEIHIGIETDEERLDLTEAFNIYQHAKRMQPPVSFAFLQVMIEMGAFSLANLETILGDSWVRSKLERLRLKDPIDWDVPVHRPSKIIGIGRNYRDHARELNHAVPDSPVFFSKSTSALTAHESAVRIPDWVTGRVDHEAELAVVIGAGGRRINAADALSHVAGYTILNDVTARDMQKSDIAAGEPWFRSKGLDTFCPLGPYLVPPGEVPDPQTLDIELSVNGSVRQQANTADMIFPIPVLIETVSRYMTLNPGDIIATGTPAGVGPIEPGDTMEICITGLGTLRNTVEPLNTD